MKTPTYHFATREDLKQSGISFIPERIEPKSTGYDVKCAEPDGIIIKPFEQVKIRLGFRTFCPEGWWFEIKPRSSTFTKKDLGHCLYGTVDESYEGEAIFAAMWIPRKEWSAAKNYHGMDYFQTYSIEHEKKSVWPSDCLKIEFGERIAQIIPVERVNMEVREIDNATLDKIYAERGGKRGAGGFGSTGSK
jgi:dUTPase